MRKFIFLCSLIFTFVNLSAQIYDENIQKVLTLQDIRSLGENNILLNYLTYNDEEIVLKILTALANIQDTTTLKFINDLLYDVSPIIRKQAAFALGQIQCVDSKSFLENALDKEKNIEVKKEIVNSLGKVGDDNSLKLIISKNVNDDELNSSIALAIARFAIRNIKSEQAIRFLKNILKIDFGNKTENNISYALFRMRDEKLLKIVENDLLLLAKSQSPYSRMWAYSALGYIGNIANLPDVYKSYKSEIDWRVKVNILNSFQNYVKKDKFSITNEMREILSEAKDDKNINVRITALRQIGELFSQLPDENKIKENIISELEFYITNNNSKGYLETGEAILSYAKIKRDGAEDFLFNYLTNTNNYTLKPYIILSFKNLSTYKYYKKLKEQISKDVNKYIEEKGMIFKEVVQDKVLADIFLSYIDLLNSQINKIQEEDINEFRLTFTEFLNSKDPRIVDICINSLNDEKFKKYIEETKFVLLHDYSNLEYPLDKEVMKLFIEEFGKLEMKEAVNVLQKNLYSSDYEIAKLSSEALQKITGEKYEYSAKVKTFHNWDYINSLRNKKFAEIETTKGKIKLELFLNDVPFTVANFIRLAEAGYYNGTLFHRVVPNFVIQGGDPTGTGWGGTEYTIRTEIFNSTFETGAVGMASSGKDTEGSQFFIMHSPHYHLDGKYTLFGKVIEGMEIVNEIFINDFILKINFTDK